LDSVQYGLTRECGRCYEKRTGEPVGHDRPDNDEPYEDDYGDGIDAAEYMEEARILRTQGIGAWRTFIGY